MVQYALHENAYLNVAKYYYKIWETPSIKEDEDGKGREVSRQRFVYCRKVDGIFVDTGTNRVLHHSGSA